jgi:hypothetical protein
LSGWARVVGLSVLSALALAGCGGSGGGTSTPSSSSATGAGDDSKLVQLVSANFDAQVISPGRVALVEFHSPT